MIIFAKNHENLVLQRYLILLHVCMYYFLNISHFDLRYLFACNLLLSGLFKPAKEFLSKF